MTFWSSLRWKSLTPTEYPIRPFEIDKLDEASYRLSIGREVYISAPAGESRIHQLSEEEAFILKPGQFSFILTEEDVVLSSNIIGFISIRASVKFYGLVNVSGFHVDPGYSGKLIFAVFNAGPTNIHLRQGDPIFNIWISDLDQDNPELRAKVGYQNIPSKIVNQISGQFLSAYELAERLEVTRQDVEALKAFNLRMKIIAAMILFVLAIVFRSLLLDMFSDIKEFLVSPVETEVGTPGAAPPPPAGDGALP